MRKGVVYLIGTGPGDPDLITVRGRDCIRAADVVVYDHLVPRRLLAQAPHGAELIDIGVASPEPMAQEAISYLLADKAREGKSVARLKWGDPFVFDRGGEEALYLHEQGVTFEVVPGIPAGIAVPAYAGVPVTYPGGGETITLLRAFDGDGKTPHVDWSSLARLEGTVVCHSSPTQLSRVLEALRDHGWPPDGQGVIVYNGTLPGQETIAGTIDELLESIRDNHRRSAAVLVVGRVAGFREHLRWFDTRPLFGRRVLVTRPREQAAELVDRLTVLGADAVEAPMIKIDAPDDPELLARAVDGISNFDWVVFSSVNAVGAFMAMLLDGTRDLRALKGPRLCAVGTGTAEALARHGIKVELVPREFRAEGVVEALQERGSLAGARVLLPRADIGREVIADGLREAGAAVTEVVAYRTVLLDSTREDDPDVYKMLLEGRIDVVTFTSASAVRNFARIYGADQAADLLRYTVVAVIGPVTAEAAEQLHIPVTITPATYTIPALVDAIAAHFAVTKASI
jgi:uroporphyrinogen III methyltransferase/synthase